MRSFDYTTYYDKKWNNDTCRLLERINEYNGMLKMFLSIKPKVLEKLVSAARVNNIISSNKIEGIVADNAKSICRHMRPKTQNEELIAGYKLAYDTVLRDYDKLPVNADTIKMLHQMLYQYSDTDGGKFKTEKNVIVSIGVDGCREVIFEPLAPEHVEEAVRSLCEEYNKAINAEVVSPLLLIPIFVSDFLCIHPFDDGNGRMSRLLAGMLLMRAGYQVSRYAALDQCVEKNVRWYYDGLSHNNIGWHENANDPGVFQTYYLCMMLTAYKEIMWQIQHVGKPADEVVSDKLVDRFYGSFYLSEIAQELPLLAPSAVDRELRKLLDKGKLKYLIGTERPCYARKT